MIKKINAEKNEYNKRDDKSDYIVDELLIRLGKGDASVMRQLYDLTSSSIYGYALSFLKNTQDSEDIVHDCFVKLYSSASTYTSQGKPFAWIFTITRNLCLQKIREQSHISDIPQEDWEIHLGSNENVSTEDRILLTELLNTLSSQDRQIVVLHAVSGMKHKDIADVLGIPLSTVLSKYKRSLEKLKGRLDGGI